MRLFLLFPAKSRYVKEQEDKTNLEHYEMERLEKPSGIQKTRMLTKNKQ